MEVPMKRLLAGIASILFFCVALPALSADSARERAIKRCNDNRGTDCKSEQGLQPWMDEEGPTTYKPHIRPKPTQLPTSSTGSSPPPAKPSTGGAKQ
jgi:hypothetical protein